MRIRLRRLDGSTAELGVSDGYFVRPEADDDDVLDYTTGYALPGLVDAHAHLQANGVAEMVAAGAPDLDEMAANAQAQLAAGVLTIADKGSKSDTTLQVLDFEPSRRPKLEMAGEIIVTPDGYYPGFGKVVEPENAAAAALEAVATPAAWVKFIGDWPRRGVGPVSNFDQAQLAAAVTVAHEAGRRVAIHTMAPGTAHDAVTAGVDSIEHGLFLTREDVEVLGARRGAWVPTIAAMEAAAEALRPGSSGRTLIQEGLDNVRELLPYARRSGVRVMAGTDLALRHGCVVEELLRLAAYGLSAADVIDTTVFDAHEYLGFGAGLTIGGPADVICVPADPREDLDVLGAPSLVMRMGRVIAKP
jgi:imidazolonepropionase-like amidohydrolase